VTASSTTITTSPRRTTLAHLGRVGRPMAVMLSAVRARWNDLAQAGQLGPVQDTEIGRHTGARI